MAERPRLVYFNARGRAESTRYILHDLGVDFEDYRFPTNADNETNPSRPNDAFQEYKKSPNCAWGQVPVLEIDGTAIAQSSAIIRYLGRKYGLYGKNDIEASKVDSLLGAAEDFGTGMLKVWSAKPEDKEAELEKFKTEFIPRWMGNFEKVLKTSGSGFFVGDSITIADYAVYSIFEAVQGFSGVDTLAGHPDLKAWYEKIASRAPIAKWRSERPETRI